MAKSQEELSLERIQALKSALIEKEEELERAKTLYKAIREERDRAQQKLYYAIDHADQTELRFEEENQG